MNSEPSLAVSLFVYGTLKKGHPAHESLCRGAVEIEEAIVRGSLFDLPAGYPALSVPQRNILATGTTNPLSDAKIQAETTIPRHDKPGPEETVHGEIVAFDDPERRLPALDSFEGFDPGGGNLYLRVLIPAWKAFGAPLVVWAYVMESPSGVRLPGGRWRP